MKYMVSNSLFHVHYLVQIILLEVNEKKTVVEMKVYLQPKTQGNSIKEW